MISNKERKIIADKILYEKGLWEKLCTIGTPHIIGSYKMDMMACNDLDIDVENVEMSIEKLYDLTKYILHIFHPSWYEAKEEINEEGKVVWFQGFETTIEGQLWNLDIWFFDKETILKAENYCDNIKKLSSEKIGSNECIIRIKQELRERNLYCFEKYTSMDVYRAVLEQGIKNTDEFLEHYIKKENKI